MEPPPSYEQAMGLLQIDEPAQGVENNCRLMKLYYISDQLSDFYKDCGLNLPPSIRLVTEQRMANAGILTSLMAMYIHEKGLKNGKRFFPDDRMKRFFQDTRSIFKGVELPSDEISQRVSDGGTNWYSRDWGVFEILSEADNPKGERFYIPEEGALFTSIMKINSWYRIKSSNISDLEKERLDSENIKRDHADLEAYLRHQTQLRKMEDRN